MYKKNITVAMVLLLLSATASACHAPASKMAFDCQVDLATQEGGRVNITRIDASDKLPFSIPMHIGWHPPGEGDGIDFAVGYPSSRVNDLGFPSGGHAEFTALANTNASQYEAVITVNGTLVARLASPDISVGPQHSDIDFSANRPSGKSVLAAVASGKQIKIEIWGKGKLVASKTFDTSAIHARNDLILKAKHLIETSDPGVCRPI